MKLLNTPEISLPHYAGEVKSSSRNSSLAETMAEPSAADRQEFDWDLPVGVPTIGVHRTLRVTSNESIGAVMIKLAGKLG